MAKRSVRPDASHRKLEFDTCSDGPANANHREHLFVRMSWHKSENCRRKNLLCNHLDARVRGQEALQQFYEDSVAKFGNQKSCPDAAYGNSNLYRIKISKAYLKKLLGIVSV